MRKMQEIDELTKALGYHYHVQFTKHERRYELAVKKLEQLSPLATLKRGYSVAMKGQEAIRTVEEVKVGDQLKLMVTDGTIPVVVSEKE